MFARSRARSSGSLTMSYRNDTVHTVQSPRNHASPYIPNNGQSSGLETGSIQDPSEDPIQGPIISGTPKSPNIGPGSGGSIDGKPHGVPTNSEKCPPGASCSPMPVNPTHSVEVTIKPAFQDDHGSWNPQVEQTIQSHRPVQSSMPPVNEPGSHHIPDIENQPNAPTPTLENATIYSSPSASEKFSQVLSTTSSSSVEPSPTQLVRPSVLFFSGRPVPPTGIRGYFPNGPTPDAEGRYPLPGSIEWRRQEARYYKYILSQEWEQRAQICIFLVIFLSIAVGWLIREKKIILRRERLARIQGPRPKAKKNPKTSKKSSGSGDSGNGWFRRKSKGTQNGETPGVILCEV
ncbi:hypothetical protein BZA77DRAFT_353955 [Pyronema omphalodes]|nr:hypothetical protein BZA77DRAFT_353955 [Pyronema omphalodes]